MLSWAVDEWRGAAHICFIIPSEPKDEEEGGQKPPCFPATRWFPRNDRRIKRGQDMSRRVHKKPTGWKQVNATNHQELIMVCNSQTIPNVIRSKQFEGMKYFLLYNPLPAPHTGPYTPLPQFNISGTSLDWHRTSAGSWSIGTVVIQQ